MADSKVSALAAITAAAITDELLIVDDPGGTPVSKRIDVGDLLSLEFGQVYTTGGAGTQSPGAAYALCTQIASDGLSSAGVTPDAANNKITITNTGHYLVAFQISFVGANSATCNARIYWNGAAQTHITLERTMGAAAAVGSGSAIGIVDVSTGATDIDLRIQTTSGVFDIKELQLIVVRVGNT